MSGMAAYSRKKKITHDAAASSQQKKNIAKMQEPLNLENIRTRLQLWITQFDRGQDVESKDGLMMGLNDMHVVGMMFCVQLHELNPAVYTSFDIEQIYRQIPRLRVHSQCLQDMSWNCLQDILTALQLEVKNFMHQDTHACNGNIDIGELLVCLMCRAGFFIAHKWPCSNAESKLDYVEVQDNGMQIAQHAVAQFLDCLHAMAGVAYMLAQLQYTDNLVKLSAQQSIYQQICADISEHHREVTLDNFYEHSMISDLFPGSIVQYKHRHQAVFHSISQVVYFNWPAYARKKQASYAEIMEQRQYTNLVCMLCEMYPDIPVLYEHTGALCFSCHTQHALAWVCIAGYWALVDRDGNCYYNKDPILALAYVLANEEIACEKPGTPTPQKS